MHQAHFLSLKHCLKMSESRYASSFAHLWSKRGHIKSGPVVLDSSTILRALVLQSQRLTAWSALKLKAAVKVVLIQDLRWSFCLRNNERKPEPTQVSRAISSMGLLRGEIVSYLNSPFI